MDTPVKNGFEKDTDFAEVCGLFLKLQMLKGQRYGDAWCKHGEAISIFGNVSRKYDRIENIIKDKIEKGIDFPPPDSEESLAETVGDLSVYCTLWMTHIKKNRPEEYESWKTKIEDKPAALDPKLQEHWHTLCGEINLFLEELSRRRNLPPEELKFLVRYSLLGAMM